MNTSYTPASLVGLSRGQSARVLSLDPGAEEAMRRRFQDLGLIPGTRVECLGHSPLGDPCAYLIRGAVIALRRSDASGIAIGGIESAPAGRAHTDTVTGERVSGYGAL